MYKRQVLKARLLDAFRRFNETGTRHYRLAASIGVVEVPHTDITALDELLARADELMYEDKKGKPVTADPEMTAAAG